MRFLQDLKKAIELSRAGIMIGLVGEIQTYTPQRMRADVQPLLLRSNQYEEISSFPILPDIPVQHLRS
ncbi:MAG: hypothetical protein K8R21_05845, partial [Leptospira sp.]|nr:hypothetical protein [Leptospira sp.]